MRDRSAQKTLAGFEGLPQEDQERLLSVALLRSFAKKEVIFTEKDEGGGFFVVVEGKVKVLKASPEGKEVILHICGPGDHIGQVALFGDKGFPASAEALTTCRLLFFPRTAILDLLRREPQLALNMLAFLSLRLRQLTVQVESLALKEVPGRLASYLLYLAEEQRTPGGVSLDSSKGQLAGMLGTTPETLSRIFSDMAERGLIEVDRREVSLLDQEGLKALAEEGRYVT